MGAGIERLVGPLDGLEVLVLEVVSGMPLLGSRSLQAIHSCSSGYQDRCCEVRVASAIFWFVRKCQSMWLDFCVRPAGVSAKRRPHVVQRVEVGS